MTEEEIQHLLRGKSGGSKAGILVYGLTERVLRDQALIIYESATGDTPEDKMKRSLSRKLLLDDKRLESHAASTFKTYVYAMVKGGAELSGFEATKASDLESYIQTSLPLWIQMQIEEEAERQLATVVETELTEDTPIAIPD